jgi:membrane protein
MASRPDPADRPENQARTPRQIPGRQWVHVLRRTARHAIQARLPLLSAGVAFFAILSIAPVLVTALSVYGAVNTPEQASRQLAHVARMLPAEMSPVVVDQLRSITAASTALDTVRGLTALAIALWTATAATTSLIDALTVAYRETETRSFRRRVGLALAIVVTGALLVGGVIAAAGKVSRATAYAPAAVRGVGHG